MLKLDFTKMHGLGNDYICVNCLEHKQKHPSEIARLVCDRHHGIGGDGLVLIYPSDRADFEIKVYHADGSEQRMRGNALRCVGKYLYDNQITDKTVLRIDTKSGIRFVELSVEEEKVVSVTIEMGEASLRAKDIPVDTDYPEFISQPMLVRGEVYLVTCVFMTIPHAVVFCEDIEQIHLEKTGPLFESHEKLPQNISTEFVQLIDRNTLKMRVWEQGMGVSAACNSGACAAVAAAVVNGHCDPDSEITVRLDGGEVRVICHEDYTLLLSGPATHVFDGTIELEP